MSWFSDYLIRREVWSKRTNYLKLKVNNIVEITDYDGTKRNCIVLPVTKRDIELGACAYTPGLYGFRGLWYKGNGTKIMSYGKIYDLGYYVEIFKLNDGGKERYCRIEDYGIVVEVNKVTKMIEVTRWEKTN